jgi:integrase
MAWGGLLPTTPDMLLRYLQTFADSLKPQTLKRRLVALKQWHLCQGFADPTAHPFITQTLTGIHHVHGKPVTKTPALSVEQLTLLVNYLQSRNQLSDWRDNALLQIGFFGAFRRSELTAIAWEQVTFVKEGMEILIPRSKTDQTGEGQVCAIPWGQTTLCPVTALKRWGEKSGIHKGPIFRAIRKNGQIRTKALSANSVNVILKRHAKSCQLPQANAYSGHSLRRGFATAAAQSGATLGAIMRQGRWRHEGTVHGYIEAGKRFEANAAGLLLSNNQVSDVS